MTKKAKVVTIGICGHPAETARRLCPECRRIHNIEKCRKWYDRERRVNWLSRIEAGRI